MKVFYTTNNINKDILLKGIEEVKKHQSKINLNFEFINLGETTTHFPIKYLNTNQRLLDSTAIFQNALKIGYVFGNTNLIMHAYDWDKYNPKPTNPSQDGLVMQMPKQFWGDNAPEIFAQYFYHELSHFKCFKTGEPDITHNYSPDFVQKPRIDWYLHLLKDLHKLVENKPIMPVVTLKRAYSDDKQQLGELSTDGFTCKTMELSYKNNQTNISAIPKGKYTCKWTFSPKFMRYTYQVMNVPNRSGIRIHSASWYSSLQGCLSLGSHYTDLNADKHADLANSRDTVKAFEQHMGKKDFILEII